MKTRTLLPVLAGALMLGACSMTTAPFMPASGLIYTSNKAPLSTEFNNTTLGTKVGTASSNSVMGLFAFGDNSIQAGAKDAGIKTVKHVDYEYTSILFTLYTRTTIYVYGD